MTRDPAHLEFDLDQSANPRLLDRIGVNAAFNAGAIEYGEHTPEDGDTTHASVRQRIALIEKNQGILEAHAGDETYQNCR